MRTSNQVKPYKHRPTTFHTTPVQRSITVSSSSSDEFSLPASEESDSSTIAYDLTDTSATDDYDESDQTEQNDDEMLFVTKRKRFIPKKLSDYVIT